MVLQRAGDMLCTAYVYVCYGTLQPDIKQVVAGAVEATSKVLAGQRENFETMADNLCVANRSRARLHGPFCFLPPHL